MTTSACWCGGSGNYPPEIAIHRRLHLKIQGLGFGWRARVGSAPTGRAAVGITAGKQLIMLEEKERHGCARLNEMGMTMLGPLLIRHGTKEQQDYYLPKILTGDHIWCQGYSEPNAGSDLASLRTEAVPDGDHWVVNGQKIWTSMAMDANWIFLLVRTDKQAKKQEGISFLLVPMDSPGYRTADHQSRYGRRVLRDVLRQRPRAEGILSPNQQGLDDGEEPAGVRRIGRLARQSSMHWAACVCWRIA